MSETAPESAAVASEEAYFETEGESPIEEVVEGAESPESEPETPATTEDAPEVEKPQKTVPLAALHEERQRIKELRHELNQTKEQTRIGNERLNQLVQVLQQREQQQNQPQIPDRDLDPVAHFAAVQQLQQREIDQQRQFIARQQQAAEQNAQYERLRGFVTQQEQAFTAEKPDYIDAVNHLKSADVRALMALGHDQQTASNMVQNHFTQLAADLANKGDNLPERIYALAQAKGYTRRAPEGQAKIQTAQRGMAASRSLGSGAGSTNNMTLEALAAMPADDFAAALKGDPRLFQRLMGG